jgi:hypothetical protein
LGDDEHGVHSNRPRFTTTPPKSMSHEFKTWKYVITMAKKKNAQ